jgi:hypothetical protein
VTHPSRARHTDPRNPTTSHRLPCTFWVLANEAGGRCGWDSPCGRAGGHRRQASSKVVLAARAPTCPKHRSPAVTNGQQRSVATPAELHDESSMGGARVLPKLAVNRVIVRAGSVPHRSQGGSQRARMIPPGMQNRRSEGAYTLAAWRSNLTAYARYERPVKPYRGGK